MHVKEINIKNRVYNYYFDSLVKAVEKSYKDLTIFLDSTKLRIAWIKNYNIF